MIKYLYIPDLPADEKFLDKVCSQFLKKAFISDAVLMIVLKTGEEVIRYVKKWNMKSIGSGCQIISVEANKFYNGLKEYLSIMDQIDCYISGSMNSQEFTYTEMAYDRGKDIISLHQDDIFEDMPINEEKLQTRKAISGYVKKLADAYPTEEYEWLLFHQGLGESYTFFYYVKAYKEKMNKKLICFCYDETRRSLLEESPYIDELLLIPLPVYAYIAIYLADKFHIKNFVLLHFLPLSTCYLDKPAEIYPAYMPKVRDFLELEIDSEFERYPVNISQHKIEYVNNLFREMGLPHKKTVFLIMDGISNGNLLATREEFFVRLATALKQNGYEVVTKGNRQLIPGCQFTILPPWESTLFAGLCGNVVTIPTGIPFAIGALNQSDEINIHMLWQTVNDATIRQNYDAWNLDHIPMLRTFGKKYFQDVINKTHDLMIDMMFSEKSKFIHYTVEEWNDQTIAKILANL